MKLIYDITEFTLVFVWLEGESLTSLNKPRVIRFKRLCASRHIPYASTCVVIWVDVYSTRQCHALVYSIFNNRAVGDPAKLMQAQNSREQRYRPFGRARLSRRPLLARSEARDWETIRFIYRTCPTVLSVIALRGRVSTISDHRSWRDRQVEIVRLS